MANYTMLRLESYNLRTKPVWLLPRNNNNVQKNEINNPKNEVEIGEEGLDGGRIYLASAWPRKSD